MCLDKTINKRLGYIDVIKGLCMLLVLVDHSGIYLPPMLDYVEVPSFFIISGFLYKNTSFKDILQKKALRLVLPYFFFAFLYAIPFLLTIKEETDFFSFKVIVWFFLYPSNSPLWFLKTLFWVFIIYKLLLLIVERNSNKWMQRILFAALILIFALIGKYIDIKSPLLLATGIPQAIVVIPLFAIGHFMAKNRVFEGLRKWSFKRGFFIFLLVVLWCVYSRSNIRLHIAEYHVDIISFYTASISAFVALALILLNIKSEIPLSWFGRNSLYILGLHLPIITVLNVCGVNEKWILLFITTIILFPLVYVVKRYFPFLSLRKETRCKIFK